MTDRPRDPGLPWMWRGRHVRPFALGMSVSAGFFGALILSGDLGPLDAYAVTVATAALLGCALLWAGWWGRSLPLLRHGLAVSAAVFAERAVWLIVAGASWSAAGISLGLAIAAGGGYLLEQDHPMWRRYLSSHLRTGDR